MIIKIYTFLNRFTINNCINVPVIKLKITIFSKLIILLGFTTIIFSLKIKLFIRYFLYNSNFTK